jgi:transposase InsO family protein
VLTDNGIQFADLPKNRQGPTARYRGHPFDRLCFVHGIEHRLTKPNHPWTNGPVERMNRTIKDATVKRYFYDTHNQLKAHLTDFLRAYNFADSQLWDTFGGGKIRVRVFSMEQRGAKGRNWSLFGAQLDQILDHVF